jgi:hypothetical protein
MSSFLSDRNDYVEKFLAKLHDTEYMIDPEANEISYGSSDLATSLREALADYELQKSRALPYTMSTLVLSATHVNRAFMVITAAFVHDMIINRSDLRIQVQSAEDLIQKLEAEKRSVEKDNQSLQKQITHLSEINKILEETLHKYEADAGDVSG